MKSLKKGQAIEVIAVRNLRHIFGGTSSSLQGGGFRLQEKGPKGPRTQIIGFKGPNTINVMVLGH